MWRGIALRHCLKLASRKQRSPEPCVHPPPIQRALGCFRFLGLLLLEHTYYAVHSGCAPANTSPLPAMSPPTFPLELLQMFLCPSHVNNCPTPPRYLAKLLERVIQTTHWGAIVCRSCLTKSLSELALVREEEEERQEVGTPHLSGIAWKVQDSLGRKNYIQPRSSLRGLEKSTSGSTDLNRLLSRQHQSEVETSKKTRCCQRLWTLSML